MESGTVGMSSVRDGRIVVIRAVLLYAVLAVLTLFAAEIALAIWPAIPAFIGCCCGGIDCFACTSSGGPDEFEVVLPTIPNGTCTTCNNYSGTYTVSFLQAIDSGGGAGECQYRVFFDKECGLFSPDRLLLRIVALSGGTTFRIAVELIGPAGPPVSTIVWRTDGTETDPYDCQNLSAEPIPPATAGTVCGIPTDDATVTSL